MTKPIEKIVVYESSYCPYCMMAKRLLDHKSLAYNLINVDNDFSQRSEMERLSGRTSVPQIFFEDLHVGGFDDLHALDQSGELVSLIDSMGLASS